MDKLTEYGQIIESVLQGYAYIPLATPIKKKPPRSD